MLESSFINNANMFFQWNKQPRIKSMYIFSSLFMSLKINNIFLAPLLATTYSVTHKLVLLQCRREQTHLQSNLIRTQSKLNNIDLYLFQVMVVLSDLVSDELLHFYDTELGIGCEDDGR